MQAKNEKNAPLDSPSLPSWLNTAQVLYPEQFGLSSKKDDFLLAIGNRFRYGLSRLLLLGNAQSSPAIVFAHAMPYLSIEQYLGKFPNLKLLGTIKRRTIRDYYPKTFNLCETCEQESRFVWFEQECSWIEFPDGTSGFFCSGDCLHEAYLEYLRNLSSVDRYAIWRKKVLDGIESSSPSEIRQKLLSPKYQAFLDEQYDSHWPDAIPAGTAFVVKHPETAREYELFLDIFGFCHETAGIIDFLGEAACRIELTVQEML